ncbi:hypothetical protein IV203_027329 [Nitzschia inconspicua]|uniref:DUF6824 domain-containing protein n=1 Tax=Nitzschia inconspicua TaxID=303405 RepID=A0A9K3Q3F2_9STRA|nr:hypothetical protein IV203_027329 [Nitzschia inconspicua]
MEHILSKGLDSLSLQDVEGVTPRLSESMIASQLNQLSLNERDFVLQDIHGVADLVEESPSFVQDSLDKFQHELTKAMLKDRQRNPKSPSACALAMQQCESKQCTSLSNYCRPSNHDFLLSFLRAEQFNVTKAVERIFRYFEEKRNLFGIYKLTRNIRLDDLDEETMSCLKCGRMQLLPSRDRAGRAVFLGVRKLQNKLIDENSLLRAFFYLGAVAARDEETQRKGVVIIQYSLGAEFASRSVIHGLGRVLRALPLRVASIHACVNDMVVKAAATIASLLIGSSNTVRVRSHCGTDMEVQYALMTFGLNVNFPVSFPISPSGEVDLSGHVHFLEQRRLQEEMEIQSEAVSNVERQSDHFLSSSPEPDAMILDPNSCDELRHKLKPWQTEYSPIIVPGELDIIFGRGKGYQNHKGNVRYRHIVETKRPLYEALSTKKEKTQLIKDVVKSIYDGGGRFLRQDPLGRWIPIDQEVARDKVSHSFRNQKRLSQIKADGVVDKGQALNRIHSTERLDRDAKRARARNGEEKDLGE